MKKIILLLAALVFSSWSHAVTPVAGLWAIDSENNGQPGRGFQIDVQYETMLLTFFGYNPDGSAQWYLSTGALTNSAFTGSLAKYERGTSFGAPLVPAVSAGNAGSVTISFSDTTHGLITLPGEAPKAISRFLFATAPAAAAFSGTWSGNSNDFKYAAVAGERLVIRVNLTTPLSDTQFARCNSNPGTGAIPSSYASQIHVYNSSNVRIGGVCGEDLTYTFPETGLYIFNFEFPSNGSGFFNAASLKGDAPVAFLEVGSGFPVGPKKINTTTANPIGSNVFINYYWISAAKGETIVVNTTLNQPLSAQQNTRCAANSGSHNSQIYVYDSKLNQVGIACGESIRFAVPESGNYIFQFNYGSQSSGVFNAAKI